MEKKFRIESDTLGEVKIDQNALWGPQTQRSINNFKIGQPYSQCLLKLFIHTQF